MKFISEFDGHHGVGVDLGSVGDRHRQLARNLAGRNDEVVVGVLQRPNGRKTYYASLIE